MSGRVTGSQQHNFTHRHHLHWARHVTEHGMKTFLALGTHGGHGKRKPKQPRLPRPPQTPRPTRAATQPARQPGGFTAFLGVLRDAYVRGKDARDGKPMIKF